MSISHFGSISWVFVFSLTSFMQYRDCSPTFGHAADNMGNMGDQCIEWFDTNVMEREQSAYDAPELVSAFLTSRSFGYLVTVRPPVFDLIDFLSSNCSEHRPSFKSGNLEHRWSNQQKLSGTYIWSRQFEISAYWSILFQNSRYRYYHWKIASKFFKENGKSTGFLECLRISEGGIRLKLMNGDCRSGIGIPCIDFTIMMSTHSVGPIWTVTLNILFEILQAFLVRLNAENLHKSNSTSVR